MQNEVRTVREVITPQLVIEGAGVLLLRAFAPSRANPYDPFLLFDHFAFNDPREGPIRGFPTHPHRGIETVTYMLEGQVRHRDSLGNLGIIGPGDVQWMTSGRGILHEEMPTRSPQGRVLGFQLWVNLPAALKMSPPRYQDVQAAAIPQVTYGGARLRVVAGTVNGVHGPVREIAAQPVYLEVSLPAGQVFEWATQPDHTLLVYLFEGRGHFGYDAQGQAVQVEAPCMLVYDVGERVRIATAAGARFMFISGRPFREPIYPYGPFVMTTREEIEQTLRDLRNGTFIQPQGA
ncbi:pirin family protein [Thermanaerothrix sp.]|jgi:redox-sensitive bicupin YhaK (pirin superfamily)|uniref:pirin family protein n=1 Tax=Thermanaerothrix sp. TaxID=2972675 RepID=UPI002ADDCCAB|nr:pirin family protein [Thermanaerothrix sp.]